MQTSIGRCVTANFLAWGSMLASLAAPQVRAETESAALRCQRLDPTALTDSAFDDPPAFLDAATDAKSTVRFPAHCVVRGTIEKRNGVGGVQFGSKFELRMPVAWNGRFMFQGGGGTDGAVLPAYGDRNQPNGNVPALAQGFAVVTTDGGHEDNDASFGLDPKARIDWGYHSVVVVTRAAKQLVSQFYGRAPDYSYLVGCSNGGRQGMMMSQRFPEEYDGIVAGDPVFRLSASHVASAWDIQTFTAIAPKGADGKPVLSRAFSDVDLKLLSDAILEDCDGEDGVKDGLVSDPKACRFDPGRLACAGEKTDACLSSPQVAALRRYIGGPNDSQGRTLYSDWPWDPAFSSPGWRAWKLGTSTTSVPNAIKAGLSNNAIRHVFLTPPEPSATEEGFDFDRDPARMKPAAEFADATSTDLARFRQRGGKIIFYHGMADPAISANDTQRYFEALAQTQGGFDQTDQFARLFLVPGMTHCFGGNGLDSFDTVSAIVAWVELSKAPTRMIATGVMKPGVSRPLCPFPSKAHYTGDGDPKDEKNFRCR